MNRIAYFFTTFLPEVRTELSKVTFPGRSEVISTTMVVIIASAVFALFLWAADMVIVKVYELTFQLFGGGA